MYYYKLNIFNSIENMAADKFNFFYFVQLLFFLLKNEVCVSRKYNKLKAQQKKGET